MPPRKKVETEKVTPIRKARAKTATETAESKLKIKGKSPKELATAAGEPYVSIVSVELDPNNVGNGAFELDWNDKFIAQLVRAGYQAMPNEPENIIVDRWFQTVCRNIIAENFEQWQANQPGSGRANTVEDLGNGKTGVS